MLRIKKPDDWHVHLRDDDFLDLTVKHAEQSFSRILAMPNLNPPLTTVAAVLAYEERILKIAKTLKPCFALYLTDDFSINEIFKAAEISSIIACKLYPKGATTHSSYGVSDINKIEKILKAMEETGLVLAIHGEVTDPSVDIFEREKKFIETHLIQIIQKFPRLKIVLEHVTSEFGVNFIKQCPSHIAATITAHHMILTRDDLLANGLKPHFYCLPVVKKESDRKALIAAAMSGDRHFFFGSDSAPHLKHKKESSLCAAGIYSQPCALETLAEIFEKEGALNNLEKFTSIHGAEFYDLEVNEEMISLKKEPWQIPGIYEINGGELVPFRAGETISWKVI